MSCEHMGPSPAGRLSPGAARSSCDPTAANAGDRDDFDSIVEASTASNGDDEHDPEGATVAFERAKVAALLAGSSVKLDEIDQAIQRCQRGTYGICECCGQEIAAERLVARATARTCLACAL